MRLMIFLFVNATYADQRLKSFNLNPSTVNENDAIADDAIRWGDNDRIAALLAQLLNAEQLLILTDTDGIYSQDPKKESSGTLN